MPLIKQDIVDRCATDVSLEEVAVSLGMGPFKRSGKYLQSKCCLPGHNDTNASFSIRTDRNTWRCFGCDRGGNAITLVMEMKGCDFREAVEYVAQVGGIAMEYDTENENDDAKRLRKQKASIAEVNDLAAEWFVAHMDERAKDYAMRRWGADDIESWDIGYAPAERFALWRYLVTEKGMPIEAVKKSGLFYEYQGQWVCSFLDRLMFPIRDAGGRTVAFTGRDMTGKSNAKYKNTATTDAYHKEEVLYGWDKARASASRMDYVVVTEGNPDAIRLHSIGVKNAVASCGTTITEKHIEMIKRAKVRCVWLMMDGDVAGYMAMDKNGRKIVESGLDCHVVPMGIDVDASGQVMKKDADSFVVTEQRWNDLKEERMSWFEYHVRWALQGDWTDADGQRRSKVERGDIGSMNFLMKDTAKVLVGLNKSMHAPYIDALTGVTGKGTRQQWNHIMAEMRGEAKEQKEGQLIDLSGGEMTADQMKMALEYGLYIGKVGRDRNNYRVEKFGKYVSISNFVMDPLFHVEGRNAKRMFKITNNAGVTREIALPQGDLVTLAAFKKAVESMGYFVFTGGDADLNKVKLYVYERTVSVKEVNQLGWQKAGFWAWCNGVVDVAGTFTEVDEYGIVNINNDNYYLPALSKFYREESDLYVAEKMFRHKEGGKKTLKELAGRMYGVYGDNAIIGIGYYLATAFRDVCVKYQSGFPLLNIFGQKGTGKSSMAYTLGYLFGSRQNETKLPDKSTTVAALGDVMSRFRNGFCHLDEYKAGLGDAKVDMLKGAWDGIGRTKMNMDKDGKAESKKVDCGVILTGQEMAIGDDALFSRVLFIMFTETTFTDERTRAFHELEQWQSEGMSEITVGLLKYRDVVEKSYGINYEGAALDLQQMYDTSVVESRIRHNWNIVAAIYKTLFMYIGEELPFGYQDMLRVVGEYMVRQNGMTKSVGDVQMFWDEIVSLFFQQKIEEGYDFRIRLNYRPKNGTDENGEPRYMPESDYIYINNSTLFKAYDDAKSRSRDDRNTGTTTIKTYLKNDKDVFRGTTKCRFLRKRSHDVVDTKDRTNEKPTCDAYILDYRMLKEKYNVNFDTNSTEWIERAGEED